MHKEKKSEMHLKTYWASVNPPAENVNACIVRLFIGHFQGIDI